MRTLGYGSDQRGFSLVEFLVALAISVMIITGLLTLLMTGNQSYVAGANQIEAQAAARTALDRMVQEIRGAGYDPGGIGFNAIDGVPPGTAPTGTGFTIQNDKNGNGIIANAPGVCNPDAPGEQIQYTLVGSESRRNANDGCGDLPIIGGVQSLALTYFDATGAQLAAPVAAASVRAIEIQITTRAETHAGTTSVMMRDRIRIRNR